MNHPDLADPGLGITALTAERILGIRLDRNTSGIGSRLVKATPKPPAACRYRVRCSGGSASRQMKNEGISSTASTKQWRKTVGEHGELPACLAASAASCKSAWRKLGSQIGVDRTVPGKRRTRPARQNGFRPEWMPTYQDCPGNDTKRSANQPISLQFRPLLDRWDLSTINQASSITV